MNPSDPRANGLAIYSRPWNNGNSTWSPVAATSGNDTAFTANTAFVGNIFLQGNTRITGVNVLVGATGGTDKWIVSLHDENGTLLANSAVAGVTAGTTAQSQQIPFTAVYAGGGPGFRFLCVVSNGTTATIRTVPAYCGINGVIGGTVAQAFGTPATFAAPTTFTANTVPVVGIY